MLHVLRHTLPLRKALLVASETVLLTVVVALVMSSHLFGERSRLVVEAIVREGLTVQEAQFRCFFSAFLVSLIAQLAISFNELYEFRVSSSRFERFSRFVASCGLAALLALVALVLARVWALDRFLQFPGLTASRTAQTLVFSLLIGFGALYLWRLLFHHLLRRWNLRERVLLVGSGAGAQALGAVLAPDSHADYELVGIVDVGDLRQEAEDSSDHLGGSIRYSSSALPALATRRRAQPIPSIAARAEREAGVRTAQVSAPAEIPRLRPQGEENLLELARRQSVDHLLVSLEDRRGKMPVTELLECRLAGMTVEEGETLYERVTGKIAVENLRPSYLIFNPGFSKSPLAELTKRAFDVLAAGLGILLLWPVMLLVALAVRFDSPGPVLFRQERTGRYGKPFVLNKFRSMRADAEKLTGPVWAQKDDPRITRVGRFIRATRLDELPQLFNVLGGSMSMVGPRPERAVFIADLMTQIPYYDQRHIVKPGVTGWAQINYPYGNTVEDALQKLQYDLFYIKYRSLPFDLSILVQTVKTVLLRQGT